ncbi:unknown [Eggerthella sp. CAG:209]|nr:unknown [Eggerthella sp. CAG:209]
MKHPILALHGAKESCQSQKSCKCTWIFVLTTGGSAAEERIPQKIGSRQQQRSQYREIGGAPQSHPLFQMTRIRSTPADPGLNRTRFSSAIKGSPLKKKSAQCESISHCALENFIVPRNCRFSAFASLRSEHQDNFYPNPSPQKNQVNLCPTC